MRVRFLSFILLLCLVLSFLSSCQLPSIDDLKFWEKDDAEFNPTVRFAVVSDIHTRVISESDATQDEIDDAARRTERFFTSSYAYAQTQSYKGLDAVLIAGDYTDDGTQQQYQSFFDIVNGNLPSETKLLACLGNHEFRDTKENGTQNNSVTKTYDRFSDYFGFDADSVNVIGGYYFIGVSADINGGRGISEEKAEWLDEQIAKAAKADKTGEKPIMVFGHLPSSGTTIGSIGVGNGKETYRTEYMDAVLQKYPQVVFMAGHSHAPVNNPLSIYQEYFTAVDTGTFTYGGYPIFTDEGWIEGIQLSTNGTYQTDMSDDYNEHGDRESCIFMIMELDAKNRLRIQYYNADTDTFVGSPVIIDSIGKTEDFTFTSNRKDNSVVPAFSSALSVRSLSATSVIVNVPNAACDDYVANYKIELYKDGTLVDKIYRLACQNQLPLPIEITASFSDLTPNTDYEVKAYAYNAYGKVSEPISLSVKTAEDETVPDVFQMSILSDGTVTDAISGEKLTVTGTPSVQYDETLDRQVASFNGTGSYDFKGWADHLDVMTDGFTFEIVGKVPAVPSVPYVDLVSGQETGGFGFEYAESGALFIYVYVLASDKTGYYAKTYVMLPVGEYFHLTATYDGHSLVLYLNGEKANSRTARGSVWFPIKESARYLSIGADADLGGKSGHFMTGEIALVNVYSSPLTAAQISQKYNDLQLP